MLEEAVSSTEKVTVYVRLLDEGTEVSRPTEALTLDEGVYQLLPTHDYDPEDERWEFPPGSKVRVEIRTGDAGDYLLAKENTC